MGQASGYRSDHIWCVIPVYNNRETIEAVATQCRARLRHVVVVDDGSTDIDLPALFRDENITVLRHSRNLGKGQAILTGLRHVHENGGRFMITIDGDGQHYPRDLDQFIPLLQDDEDLLVIGCRNFSGTAVTGKSRFGRKFANFWLGIETGLAVDDCQSGFRAYPVNHLRQLPLHGSHYDLEAEVLARAAWAGLRLVEVPVDVWYPEPEKRVSSFRPFLDNLRLSRIHSRLVGRCLVPWPHRRLVKERVKYFDAEMFRRPATFFRRLLKERATPGGLAAAAAVGVFLGTLPLVWLHTLVIFYVATRLHLNKVMALTIQTLCVPPFVPVACIELGHYLLHGRLITEVSLEVVFGQIMDRLWEWLIGSLVIAPLLATLIGVIVYGTAVSIQKRMAVDGNA